MEIDPKYAEEAWQILEDAIYEIYIHNASSHSREELYRYAYNMVLHKYGEQLYSGLITTMTWHMKEISKHIETAQGGLFLEEINWKWEDHKNALKIIRDIFMYMDRTFVPSSNKTPVYGLGLRLWRDNIIHPSGVQMRLPDMLIDLVNEERKHKVKNGGLMRNIVKMLVDLGPFVYEVFEKPFLEATAKFYRDESQQFIEYCDCNEYLKNAEWRLNEEKERFAHCLDAESEAKITNVVEKEMIGNHMRTLVHMENSGVVNMLVNEKYDDLGRMYSLFHRVPDGLLMIRDVLTTHLRETEKQFVTDLERIRDPVDFVQRLLDEKDKNDMIISMSFDNDKTFQNALNSSFEFFIKNQMRLPHMLIDLVNKERTSEVKNGGLMRNMVKMLVDLGPSVYEEVFEKPFLEASTNFYRAESQQFIKHCDCSEYLKKAEWRLNEEERFAHCLDAKSEAKITNVVEKEMIVNHMRTLVHMENSGVVNMLINDKYDDLGRMYSLFHRVPDGLLMIRDVLTSHLRETGKLLVTDPERIRDPVNFVQRLLDEKDKNDKIISISFNNDKTFQNALNSSFEFFINLNARSPEFISLFVDDKLQKGLKEVSEEDVEIVFDKVMMLLRFLQQKDIFEKYYRQHLAKRLLSGKTASDNAERSLIVKLKTECGCQFTSKLEGMFTDMKTSQETMKGFYASQFAGTADCPSLAVQILTTVSWPTQPSTACNLPAEILGICEMFRAYYLSTHTGRRLSWQTNMGTADLKATFGNGQKHELNVSTYQMCILMLFNSADRLSYKEIEQASEIPTSELKRCLQSLACVKGKNVLLKEPMSKDIGEDDAFFFNDKFTSKLYKVKIGTVVTLKESEPENQEMRQRIEEDRKPQIEAAIVRIMKSRRVLDHNNIVAEVTKQLQSQFLPNPVVIKKRIESLMEREFLERDKVDRKLYRYLA